MDLEMLLSYPWRIMLPEFTILGVATIVSIVDLFMREKVNRTVLAYLSIGGIVLALFFLFQNFGQPVQEILHETYRLDGFANAFKLLFLLGTGIVFLSSLDYVKQKEVPYEGEFYYLILTALLGAMIVASSADMITLFVGLELLSISSYILVGTRKHHLLSNESAMKYVISGGIASAVMLYGMSFIYGLTGTTNLFTITERLFEALNSGYDFLIYFAFFVTFVGMAFKITVVPFHMWAADVYQGAPTPVTAFLSVVSKAAGFALIMRFFLVTYLPLVIDRMPTPEFVFSTVGTYVAVLAALSMIIGNTLALRQTNIKRMMAYSGIAQAGYILVPFVVATNYAYVGMANVFFNYTIFYLLAYLLMNLGAFAVISLISQEGNTDDIKAYAGLYRRSPWKALSMTVFMLSLAGIPLTAGFIGKFNIIASAIGVGYVWLGAVMIITSVISYYYYFGIIRQMYMRDGNKVQRPLSTPVGSAIVIIFSLVGTLLLGTLLPGVTLEWIDSTFDLTEIFISGHN